jgi:hypothetical protein
MLRIQPTKIQKTIRYSKLKKQSAISGQQLAVSD